MLSPKRVKFRKMFKGRMNGLNGEFKGNPVNFMRGHILHPNPGWSNSGGIVDQRDLPSGHRRLQQPRP